MVKQKTAVLLPSLNRPEQVKRCVNSLRGTTDWRLVDIKVMIALGDIESERALSGMPIELVYEERGGGSIAAWNKMLGLFNNYAAYVPAADDLVFKQDWYAATMRALQLLGGSGLVGFNDLNRDGVELATHWYATRDFLIEHNGGVIYTPHYKAWYCDPEVNERAKRAGAFIWARDAHVEHLHPNYGKADTDATYSSGAAHHAADAALFTRRQAAGFPDDFEPILTR